MPKHYSHTNDFEFHLHRCFTSSMLMPSHVQDSSRFIQRKRSVTLCVQECIHQYLVRRIFYRRAPQWNNHRSAVTITSAHTKGTSFLDFCLLSSCGRYIFMQTGHVFSLADTTLMVSSAVSVSVALVVDVRNKGFPCVPQLV